MTETIFGTIALAVCFTPVMLMLIGDLPERLDDYLYERRQAKREKKMNK